MGRAFFALVAIAALALAALWLCSPPVATPDSASSAEQATPPAKTAAAPAPMPTPESPAPSPLAAPALVANQVAPPKDSETAFAKLVENANQKLPTLTQIKALPAEQKHNPPALLLSAAPSSGPSRRRWKKIPPWLRKPRDFYLTCAKRDDLATAVRASA